MSDRTFLDSNILLYLLASDSSKADAAEKLVASNPVISVQVLNEICNVALKKLNMPWAAIDEFVTLIRALCRVEPLTTETNLQARRLSQRYQLSFYDACIVASALLAKCEILYSEDLHSGIKIEGSLTVVNPFLS